MGTIDWDDDLIDLNLGCQNIFDEMLLESIDVAGLLQINEDFYEPKSKNVIKTSKPP